MKKVLRRISIILNYFFFEGSVVTHIKTHSGLVKSLRPFKKYNLISYKTYSIYLFSYISRSLTTTTKLQTLIHHYSYLKGIFSVDQLNKLFKSGIELYCENTQEDKFTITLVSNPFFEMEGSLSLLLNVNDVSVANLSFTFVPGENLGITNSNAIYISRLQRNSKQLNNVAKTKKHFKDIVPAVILLKSLEAISTALGIKKWIGISAANQLSFKDKLDYEKYYAVYDEFWKLNGGELVNGNYIIDCPSRQKDILLIKQTHRNRARRKRQQLNEIYDACFHNMTNVLSGSDTYNLIENHKSVYIPHLSIDSYSLQPQY